MGLCLSKATAASPCWTDLPPEIAGLILSRLPTHHDRLTFRTVCRGWSMAARQLGPLLPPAVPYINLGRGMYQSIVTDDNGTKAHRRRFPMPAGFHVRAIFGDWVLYSHERSSRCFLYKLFMPDIKVWCCYEWTINSAIGTCNQRAMVSLRYWIVGLKKIMVSSSSCLVAALTANILLIDAPVGSYLFSSKTTNVLWTRVFLYKDIAFYRGKIFAVSSTEHLFSHCLVAGEALSQSPTDPMDDHLFYHWSSAQAPSQIRTQHVIKEHPSVVAAAAQNYYHLVASSDEQELLMVRWSIRHPTINDIKADNREINLHVFKADMDEGMWSEVKDLGSQVLFVGRTGSRAFLVEGSSQHYYGRKFGGGNRVFILGHDWALARRRANANLSRFIHRLNIANGIPTYCDYNMVTSNTSLVSLNIGRGAEWFFPSE